MASLLLPCSRSHPAALSSVFITWSFKGKLVLFPPLFIFNGLFLSACTHGYLFYSLGCCDRSLYFILLLNFFQFWPLEVFSGCLLCSLSGTFPCYFSLCLEYFLSPGTTQCSCSSCASLPPSWKHPRLQGIAVLSFGSLENGICGVRTQRGELVLPDVLLPDSLADSQWCTGSSRCVCLGSTW